MSKAKIGMWLYSNGGGGKISKILSKNFKKEILKH